VLHGSKLVTHRAAQYTRGFKLSSLRNAIGHVPRSYRRVHPIRQTGVQPLVDRAIDEGPRHASSAEKHRGFQWSSPAYNPATNVLVAPTVDWCGVFKKAGELRHIPGQLYMGGSYTSDPVEQSRGWLTAVSASTGTVVWKYQSKRPLLASVTITSANLVFTGELTGDFVVMDASQGDILYRFNTGGPVTAGVITYAVNGKQYVAVASGATAGFWRTPPASSTLIIFALP
jgi:alcohol dehydrogenase (cytochrome c)